MKKSILRIICVIVSLLFVANSVSAQKQNNLNKGLTLFGAHLGTNSNYFAPYAKNKLVQSAEIYTIGWGTIEKEEGKCDWGYIDEVVKMFKESGKNLCIRIPSAAHGTEEAPRWLHNNYNVRRILARSNFITFEQGSATSYNTNGALTVNNEEIVAQSSSLLLSQGKFVNVDIPNASTSIIFGADYKAITDATFDIMLSENVIKTYTVKKQTISSVMLDINAQQLSGNAQVKIAVKSGEISFDNLSCGEDKSGIGVGNLSYPNYFDPIFFQKYENFVKQFSEKYKDEPTIAMVVVGGFGRWDEPALDSDVYETKQTIDFKNQWKAFGYTDKKYTDHIIKCMDLFIKYFGNSNKQIQVHTLPFSLTGNANLVAYTLLRNAIEKGLVMKTNGVSHRFTEWDSKNYPFTEYANRYKMKDKWFILEEGGQINNPQTAENMGYPLSLFNRLLTDNIDNYWFYDADIQPQFISKYAHYANEQAGNALFSYMYNDFGKFSFFSSQGMNTINVYDMWTGLYTVNYKDLNYSIIDGKTCVSTTNDETSVLISLDDRQKYNGMFGSVLTIDYYDEGNNSFNVVVKKHTGSSIGENVVLGTVQKTNSKTFKSVSFYNSEWTNSQHSSVVNFKNEISLVSVDGISTFSNIDLSYVPAREWKEKTIVKVDATSKTAVLTENPLTLEIPMEKGKRASSIALTVGSKTDIELGYSNLSATVDAQTNTDKTFVTKKDLYMPVSRDELLLPVANAPMDTQKFIVEIVAEKGQSYVFLDKDDKPSYTLNEYDVSLSQGYKVTKDKTVSFDSLNPLIGVSIKGSGNAKLTINKILPDGKIQNDIINTPLKLNGTENIYFEPQTAGKYHFLIEGTDVEFNTISLNRAVAPNKPKRNLVGEVFEDWKKADEKIWTKFSNLKNIDISKDGTFTANVAGENPSIETAKTLSLKADDTQQFHIIMKNSTSSPMAKVYWKTDSSNEYSEDKVALIPIVPNDSEYREYSWPIGIEKGYKGTITGYKVVPVSGHILAGEFSIFSMEIRKGTKVASAFNEPLDIKKLDTAAYTYVGVQNYFNNNILFFIIAIVLGLVILLLVFLFIKSRKKAKENNTFTE